VLKPCFKTLQMSQLILMVNVLSLVYRKSFQFLMEVLYIGDLTAANCRWKLISHWIFLLWCLCYHTGKY